MDDDGDDKDDTKRRTRNLSEKKRRDQFNMLVNELSAMVSINNRKMDKSTVLKATISFLKNHNETTERSRVHDVQEHWKPSFLSNEEFTYLVLESLDGFFMVFSVTGRIFYVSESITSLLGHNSSDIINMSLFDLVFEGDVTNLYNTLQNPGKVLDPRQPYSKEFAIKFQCYLRRGILDFRDDTRYELVQFKGYMTTHDQEYENMPGCQEDPDTRLFVCTGKIYKPQLIRDVSLIDSNRSEFTSRHSLEWKFLFLDHRAPPIIGYLPFEVLGTSGYDYYHFDDLEKVITCHETLMQKGEVTSCYYRFLTKGQQWVWLQTRFYITYHQWNSKPEFVVCTHRVVSSADVAKSMRQEVGETETTNQSEPVQCDAVKKQQTDKQMIAGSPTYMSEASEAYGAPYQVLSQPASIKSVSAGSTTDTIATAAMTSWSRQPQTSYHAGSDTASVSGDSQSQKSICSHKNSEPTLVPQHGIGARYLEPAPYVRTVGLPLALQPLPVLVSPDQAQIQEQLQRKHEELQQMIVRQQEELRQVKEQLLFARLGILQPLINVQSAYQVTQPGEEMLPNQRGISPVQIIYEGVPHPAPPVYPQQSPPPHTNNNRPHMPQ